MTDDIRVVGRVGVTRLHLIGGPLDGVVKWGVIGSALTLRLKRPKRAETSQDRWSVLMFGAVAVKGDEWKETDAQGVTRHYQHHAVYVPAMRDGKATDRVVFEGVFAVEVPAPKKPEAPPQPEYEAEEDEDGDDD